MQQSHDAWSSWERPHDAAQGKEKVEMGAKELEACTLVVQ